MAKVYFSHGDKGGVGKSMLAALLVEFCLKSDYKVGIVEGDINQPDIALRYKPAGVPVAAVNLARAGASEEAVLKFIEKVESLAGVDHIIVNLPASSSETLDANAEVIVEALKENGHEPFLMYSMGHTPAAAETFKASATGGLFGAVEAEHRAIVYPLFQGEPTNSHFVKSGLRDEYAFGGEMAVPVIKPEALVQKVLSTHKPYGELVKPGCGDLSVAERIMFDKKFYGPAMAEISKFFD